MKKKKKKEYTSLKFIQSVNEILHFPTSLLRKLCKVSGACTEKLLKHFQWEENFWFCNPGQHDKRSDQEKDKIGI